MLVKPGDANPIQVLQTQLEVIGWMIFRLDGFNAVVLSSHQSKVGANGSMMRNDEEITFGYVQCAGWSQIRRLSDGWNATIDCLSASQHFPAVGGSGRSWAGRTATALS
jgi:hypothetical protein